jgi:hypothetical protein
VTTILQAAQARATALTQAGTPAYTDERKALANRPCLLFAPPILDYANGGTMCGPKVTFRIFALSTFNAPSFEAMGEIQDLIEGANEVLDIERAEPIQYPVRDKDRKALTPLAAYLLTTTDYPL